jgi:hypothetical protein
VAKVRRSALQIRRDVALNICKMSVVDVVVEIPLVQLVLVPGRRVTVGQSLQVLEDFGAIPGIISACSGFFLEYSNGKLNARRIGTVNRQGRYEGAVNGITFGTVFFGHEPIEQEYHGSIEDEVQPGLK